jgi:glycosyltransferase involved in cell wall biosynthesis
MTKILHIVASIDPATGGVAESIVRRGERLVEMGHTVEVVSLDDPASPALRGYPLPLHALGPSKTAWNYSARLKPWLRQNAQRFDAVVVDGLWQYLCYAAHSTLRPLGVPYFVFTHGMLDPWFKRAYPLKHLKKWLFWPWAEYPLLRDAQAVLFTCEEERRLARQSFWLYRARERLAPLGTTEPPANAKALAEGFLNTFPQLRGQDFLLFLGRIHPKKGCDLLLQAFANVAAAHPAQQLVMAGPGDPAYLAQLHAQAQALGVAHRVHWVGMLKGDAKWGSLYASAAFVLPSHQENFGIAVAEALACAKPVLISDKVNIWREIAADRCGVVQPDTAAGTTALLTHWLTQTPSAQAAAATRARQCYEQRFTIQASARGLLHAIAQHP